MSHRSAFCTDFSASSSVGVKTVCHWSAGRRRSANGGRTTIVARVFVAGGKGMTNRCLLGAGVALAVALGGAQAHAQLGWLAPPPGSWSGFYIGPEGGWTALTGQTSTTNARTISTVPGQV